MTKKNFNTQACRSLMQRSAILLAALLLAVTVAGCTALRLSYNNGETIVFWWLNAYVNFEHDQSPWVRKHIDELFAWHRANELKNYVPLLTMAQKQLQGPVTRDMLLSDYEQVKKQAMVIADKSLPALADLALALKPEQLVQLQKKFASNNDEYRKNYLKGDTEKRQAYRYKKVLKQAEFWFGNFNGEQEKQIRQFSDARPLNNELWMNERIYRQTELIKLLSRIQTEKPSREATIAMLKSYVNATVSHFGQPERAAFFKSSTEASAQMVAQIINLATPEQKAHAQKRLQAWIDDTRALMAER